MFILTLHVPYDGMVTLVAFSTEEEAMQVLRKWEQGIPTGIKAVDNPNMRYSEHADGTVYDATGATSGNPEVLREF